MLNPRVLVVAVLVASAIAPPTALAGKGRPPANTSLPTISGTAVEGQTLTASTGSWRRSPTSYAYAWQDCDTSGGACTPIAGATASTYGLVAADVGHTIRVVVTATNAYGSSSATSAATAVVTAAPVKPSSIAAPTVSGTPEVGQLLTTSDGNWSGSTPMSYAYQWQDCDTSGAACTPISGATSASYRLASADQGHTIRSVVIATNAAGSAQASSAATAAVQAATTPPAAAGLHVSGNQLLDAAGAPLHLHGVNRSGTEYACIQGWGIFDGPSDDASVTAIRSWNSNIVRIPLNEDCWLNINGVNPAYAGTNYRTAIVNFVNLLHQHGMYAELSLMWAAPGTTKATSQPAAPDADHSPALWSSLAATFKDDPDVILAPWGETTVSADCFLNGCVSGYQTAGMQQAVDVMRQAGYNGVIAIPGINYANDLTQWLSHQPNDPLVQLIAEAHVYGKNTCSTTSCFDTSYAPVAAQVPLIFGETGETYDASSCGSTNISSIIGWADAHNVGYAAWTWDTWGNCSALISNYNGTPANTYGSWIRSHYLAQP